MKIKGFGGVFWRTGDVAALSKWYKDVLGIEMESWNGTVIKPQEGNETIFSFFSEDDGYFPAGQQVMVNFQVESIEACMMHLEKVGVPLVKDLEKSEYGSFIWIDDPEGRRIELWEK
ncbi:VOC family protein [Alkalihalobacillus sp. CinArs1]|uniref:VOC family protein n=1 Tax=Alkalihalobacillus sp. CinArs1 TaxID=2995314 RepID=UPI0022DD8F24|nr:VOC family protein [Alkalihalobacillus sp. CinArs1]